MTVLKENGEAAAKRSCVLIGGPRSALAIGWGCSNSGRKTDRGVMAGLNVCVMVDLGVVSCFCDHGRWFLDTDVGKVLSWNSSCARSIAACVDIADCRLERLDLRLSCSSTGSVTSSPSFPSPDFGTSTSTSAVATSGAITPVAVVPIFCEFGLLATWASLVAGEEWKLTARGFDLGALPIVHLVPPTFL